MIKEIGAQNKTKQKIDDTMLITYYQTNPLKSTSYMKQRPWKIQSTWTYSVTSAQAETVWSTRLQKVADKGHLCWRGNTICKEIQL